MNKNLTVVVALALVAGLLALGGGQALAATLVVDDDGFATAVNCDDSVAADSTTIQSAVDLASPGDTVFICPGIYNEQVKVVTNDLTIQGSGAGSTVIKPSSVSANTSSLFSGNPIAAIVVVEGTTGVELADLTVDGSTAAFNVCSPGYMGIFYRASSGAINDTQVLNIFHPTAPGCQAVLGIFVQSGNGGLGLNSNVAIGGTVVDNYGKNGITANEAGTFVTVTNNVVTGRGPVGSGDAAQNGVQIGFGARGRVTENTISDNDYTPTSWVACGLLFFEGGGGLGKTTTNTFSGNEQNVCTAGVGPSAHSPFNE